MTMRLLSLLARWPTTLRTIAELLLIGMALALIAIVWWVFWIIVAGCVLWLLVSAIRRDRRRSPHDQLRDVFPQPPGFKAGGIVPTRPEPDELTHKARRW